MLARPSSSPFTTLKTSAAAVDPPLIGALLRMPWELVRHRMLERLHQQGFDDLESQHLNVLQYPGPDGTRPSELAARLRISKQALNYLLGQLEAAGYLERVTDSRDLRSRQIALSTRGGKAVHVIRDAVAEVEADWAEKLGAERFAQLRTLLLELGETRDPSPATE
jgi:DNA-binding MarR family transcriptional regulator